MEKRDERGRFILNRNGTLNSWSPPSMGKASSLCCDEMTKILVASNYYANAKFKILEFNIIEGNKNGEVTFGRTTKDLYLGANLQIDTKELNEANDKSGLPAVCDILFAAMIKILEAVADKYKLGYDKKHSMIQPDWAKLDAEKKWATREETIEAMNKFRTYMDAKEKKEREEQKRKRLEKQAKTIILDTK